MAGKIELIEPLNLLENFPIIQHLYNKFGRLARHLFIMKKELKISIPAGISFADLKLDRSATGSITFDANTINKICEHSGIDPKMLWESREDNMAGLIVEWYASHLKNGGEHDPVADDLIAEALAEDDLGSGISHKPGKA